jgi:two-component system, OmpR family, alkaline phosphatase synthesis response regulator PhoP
MQSTGHVLIIDDEPSLRRTLARILQRANLEVTTAGSGQEGLAFLAQQSFDLVYLDIRMPDMSGLEALKVIHSKYPELDVVLFTAQPDMNSAVEALRHGATDYLLKPLQPQAFIDRTHDILARKQRERRKREIQTQIEALQVELSRLEHEEDVPPMLAILDENVGDRFIIRGNINLDVQARRLKVGEQIVSIPPATFDYLVVLARHAPSIVDYQTLVAEAQGFETDFREAQELVKWHVHHIRQAIEPNPRKPIYLINQRGTGYRLVAD